MFGFSLVQVGIAASIAAAIFTAGLGTGIHYESQKANKEKLVALEIAAKKTADLAKDINASHEKFQQAFDTLRDANAKLIIGLSNRSARRLPGPRPATCEGSTGPDLSRPDAVFLTEFSTRARLQGEALKLCYEENDELRNAMRQKQ